MVTAGPVRRGERQPDADLVAADGAYPDVQLAAEQGNRLAHAGQPVIGSGAVAVPVIPSSSAVGP